MDTQSIRNSSLIQRLQSVRDYRASRGKRYPLWIMLLICILGVMSGAQGYKALEDFGIRHYCELCESLDIELKRLPSDTTLRRMFHGVDMSELTATFNAWSQAQFAPPPGAQLAIDGKSLASTLIGHKASFQDFVGVVSLYSHQHRVVLAQRDYQNKHESEIVVVQQLIEALDLCDVVFTMDALHAQKNTEADSGASQSLFGVCQRQPKTTQAVI